MKKFKKTGYLVFILIFLIMGKNVKSQVYNTIIHMSWEKPEQLEKDQIKRPDNVAKHAYLFESDQVNFKVYFWVEYAGLIDTANEIHKLIVYEHDGTKPETNYFFVVKGGKLNVDLNDYQVNCALSRLFGIITNGKDFTLLTFNYPHAKEEYPSDAICDAPDKENYKLVQVAEENTYAPDICPVGPAGEFYIKIEETEQSEDIYTVTIQDDFLKFHKYKYKLKSDNSKIKTTKPKYPFNLKYYHIDEKRIYLLDKGFYLEQI